MAIQCKTETATRWRNKPIVPASYDDIPALVKLARRLRREIVEFDWIFTRDELLGLRRAVFEWDTQVRGTYRRFDSRILVAINNALGEPESLFSLREPKGFGGIDCRTNCCADGDLYRLKGHATFDLVFAYASEGIQESGCGHAFLLPTVRDTLAASVQALGWDLRRFNEDGYRPVRNALYGMAPDRGREAVPPDSRPEMQWDVAFKGPFSAYDDMEYPCLFVDPIASKAGVYIWTVNVDGAELPWYVGQTRRGFGQRMAEHIAAFLSGQYPPQDAAKMAQGINERASGAADGEWPQNLPVFLRNSERLIPNVIAQIRLFRFHFAPISGDGHLHDRVEGAIGRYLKAHTVPAINNFFAPGLKVPSAIPGDQRLRLKLSTDVPIMGLPLEILEPHTPFSSDVRHFVDSSSWTFAKTYGSTWPHEYLVRTPENAKMILALAKHIFEHGVAGRFYSEVRRYHHEGGKVYWSMDKTPEATDLINRCEEAQTFEARLASGNLPNK